jgi:hypothetical protein
MRHLHVPTLKGVGALPRAHGGRQLRVGLDHTVEVGAENLEQRQPTLFEAQRRPSEVQTIGTEDLVAPQAEGLASGSKTCWRGFSCAGAPVRA